jgi:hypothetical protein
MKALVFGEIQEGELVDDTMFMGGKKFIYGDCLIAVEYIKLIDEGERVHMDDETSKEDGQTS